MKTVHPFRGEPKTSLCFSFCESHYPLSHGFRQFELSNQANVHESVHQIGADPEIFEKGGPEAIIYKILERGGPKSLKVAFECSFQLFSYKSFANIPPNERGGGRGLS